MGAKYQRNEQKSFLRNMAVLRFTSRQAGRLGSCAGRALVARARQSGELARPNSPAQGAGSDSAALPPRPPSSLPAI